MQVYRGTLKLLDYVFFATIERGKVYETGAFIHNYALAYALGLAYSEYTHLEQKPNYEKELAPLNARGVYVTPAAPASPEKVAYRLVQWNSIQEGYAFAGKIQSIGYPDWGFARLLRPESTFTFYLLVAEGAGLPKAPALRDALEGRPVRIRLGKFPGKALITLRPAEEVREEEGDFTATPLLNWRDLPADPVVCDVLAASLPTRLVYNARFTSAWYYEVRFDDERIRLPAGMRFLARS
ncbi:MAG TPA: type I-D CRISPR-associated protein Cas5/Csc1 [Chloroflexi bacterium]|nr:type I-D CRISPR-associated protein Cas5/Csc1 [Chloroflexota bacterium]